MADTAIIDIDGTLVDTNYQHALAWFRAFGRFGIGLPLWRIHRHIGMGGDQLVPALAGAEVEQEHGDALREAWSEEFEPYLAEIRPFDGAAELLAELARRGLTVVLASSGRPRHVEHFLDLVDGREHSTAWTTSEDVDTTKPEPDLFRVALERAGGGSAVVVGDSTWDFVAARRLGLPGLAVRTGGFASGELREAGADRVFDSPAELLNELDGTPLAGEPRRADQARRPTPT
ncbi:MAG TPA: HAD family hydrolase [Pseudonocardiaceae bacterium]